MSSYPQPPILVGAALKERRDAANLSQRELAKEIGVSLRSVQFWEAGSVPQPRHRRALEAFFAGDGEVAA